LDLDSKNYFSDSALVSVVDLLSVSLVLVSCFQVNHPHQLLRLQKLLHRGAPVYAYHWHVCHR